MDIYLSDLLADTQVRTRTMQAGGRELSVVIPIASGGRHHRPPPLTTLSALPPPPSSSPAASAPPPPPARSATHRRAAASHGHPSKADPISSALYRNLGLPVPEKKRWSPELEKKSTNREAHPVIQILQDLRKPGSGS
ncbi:hypothetical protein [Oryza sativa Japonica Group]|uniref:Uncharacterized protein OSJNBb0024F06.12 n=1 Tax=Oryza sativa subsp. japonica TaxID=39947 RepID=Q8LJ55_ORYSJ|nr:hypothetical protein [Oryza sativa Japonica Group]